MITFQIFESNMKNKKYKVIIYKNQEKIKQYILAIVDITIL